MFAGLSSSLSSVVNFYCPAMVTDKLLVGLLTSHTDFSIPILRSAGKEWGGEDQRAGERLENWYVPNFAHWWSTSERNAVIGRPFRLPSKTGPVPFHPEILVTSVRGSGSGSIHHQAKIVRKTLISTVLWLLHDFLSLKNDVNVPVFRIRIKIRRIRMFPNLLDSHPDTYQNVTDPQHCWAHT